VYDVVKKQNIWQSTNGSSSQPVWSPDGQQVAIANPDDGQLYLVSRSGQITPILPDEMSKDASTPVWSPDGQFIVFINGDNLMLYNKPNKEVIDLCFQGRLNKFNSFFPVWSSDSQQIFVPYEGLVDLRKKVVYTADEITNSEITGWMSPLP
jgi:Tol biopolymer transport system component